MFNLPSRVWWREHEGGAEEGWVWCGAKGMPSLSNINTDGNHLCLNKRTRPHSPGAESRWFVMEDAADVTVSSFYQTSSGWLVETICDRHCKL